MSVQDTSSLTRMPDAKPRPEVPPKPSTQANLTGSSTSQPDGKVKRIVNIFNQPGPEEQPTNNTPEPEPTTQLKMPPKPKPDRASREFQTGQKQLPPLPIKKNQLQKQKDGILVDGISVEGSQSAHDGKEEEAQPTRGTKAQVEPRPDKPQSPCCDSGCSCVCHRQRPGMKLIWVPADVENGTLEVGGEKDDHTQVKVETVVDGKNVLDVVGEKSRAKEKLDRTSVASEHEKINQEKAKLHQSLDVLIANGQRRRSDPGPHITLNCPAPSCTQSPPVPPKRTQAPSVIHRPPEDEKENIYEAILPVFDLTSRKPTPACKELDIPLIKVLKPSHRYKLPHSLSDPMSESQANNKESISSPDIVPPAIPPRMPLNPVSRSHSPAPRGGIPLPQPTLDERRALLAISPSISTASGTSPRRAITPPPAITLIPHRPPPPPPKTDPRRLSSVSLQNLTQKKDGEEDGGNEGKEVDTLDTLHLKRESSFNWESRLQDEPLYQTYRASVISREIQRQTVTRNISKTSADYAMDIVGRGPAIGNGPPRGSSVPLPGQSTLWQDLSKVQESGVLEQLTPEQCKYQESMFEVLTSEASYLRSLQVLTEHFLDSRELEDTMIIMEKKTLFSSILKIREVSERFLKDLEDRIFEKLVFSDICDIIFYHSQHKFPVYIDYVRNQIYQEQTFTKLMKNNVQFAAVITRLQESPQCQRLPFMSFLLLPFQRITRIKMLVENILKRTKERTTAEQTASKALASVSKIIDECNTEVGKMRQMEELIYISKTLEFDKLKAIPIISQNRYLEKKGELQEISKGATLFNTRHKFNPIYLFLFNDLLIITAKKGTERFVVLDHAHRSLVQVQQVDESGNSSNPCENSFNLTLLENQQGRTIDRLLKAPSQSDMHRWVAAFPSTTNPDQDEDEVIYEDWDCPQVQCVEQYIAQQADELSLEPADIVNVIRKTNEGWYEGSRLSDGQKGWFPAVNVIEITNEHVRRRNLRERYRVMQAASIVANNKVLSKLMDRGMHFVQA